MAGAVAALNHKALNRFVKLVSKLSVLTAVFGVEAEVVRVVDVVRVAGLLVAILLDLAISVQKGEAC